MTALATMDLVLCNLKVPANEDILKDNKKLWKTFNQKETHQAIKDKLGLKKK